MAGKETKKHVPVLEKHFPNKLQNKTCLHYPAFFKWLQPDLYLASPAWPITGHGNAENQNNLPKKNEAKIAENTNPKKNNCNWLCGCIKKLVAFFVYKNQAWMRREMQKKSNLTFQARHTPIAPTWNIGSHFMGCCKIEPLLTTTVMCRAMKPHHKKTAQRACHLNSTKVLG